MRYDPDRHHRRSVRLRDYQYDTSGCYCVTICTQQRQMVFGSVDDGVMEPNDVGVLVQAEWLALPQRFPSVELDGFVLMPNHMHGIIFLDLCSEAVTKDPVPILGAVIGAFKSLSARATSHGQDGYGKLWQRNYYDQIIRSEAMLNGLRQYILDNPAQWQDDPEYPS